MNKHLLTKAEKEFLFSPWTIAGFLASVAVAYFGSALLAKNTPAWWYHDSWPGSLSLREALFYVSVFLLCLSWLRHALKLRRLVVTKSSVNEEASLRVRVICFVIALWALPLVLGPSLFSQDMYSYLAQGELWRLGQNPYLSPPTTLLRFHQTSLLGAVSPFWRHTTSPYGPLFVAMAGYIYDVAGQNLTTAVILMRLAECVGVALGGFFLIRLTGEDRQEASLALWLGIGSPLVLFELIAAGHNDALMVGLVVLGIFLAKKNHLWWAFLILGIAVMVKAPAALAALLIVAAVARSQIPKRKERIVALVGMDGVLLGALSALLGVGLDWVSTNILSAPGKVHIATTLSVELAFSFRDILSGLSSYFSFVHMSSLFSKINLAIFVLSIVYFVLKTRWDNLTHNLALLFIISVFLGPATWPWYFTWGIVFLVTQRHYLQSLVTPLAIMAISVLIKPNGILSIPSQYAPAVLAILTILAVWHFYHSGIFGKRSFSRADITES